VVSQIFGSLKCHQGKKQPSRVVVMQIWIGTSGYSYPDWVGPFYPPGTTPGRMLSLYCQSFPLVELNFSFYRLPTPAMLAGLAARTPDRFQFIVKIPRTLSHDESPAELPAFRQAIDELSRRQRLLGLLCQLPQASHNTARHRSWLGTLAGELGNYRLAVEFRHHSWNQKDVPPWLAEKGLDLVAVDAPRLPALYPSGLVQSTPRMYVRFHSRSGEKWYLSDKERYDYDYDDSALNEWVRAVDAVSDRAERVLLLFNNCRRGQAAGNAGRMHQLLQATRLGPALVEPVRPAQRSNEQRRLFD
jgi:uncharacterized protein YecE (DUF72 family)